MARKKYMILDPYAWRLNEVPEARRKVELEGRLQEVAHRRMEDSDDFEQFHAWLRNSARFFKREWGNQQLGDYLRALIITKEREREFFEFARPYYLQSGETLDFDKPGWKLFAMMLLFARDYQGDPVSPDEITKGPIEIEVDDDESA